MIMFNDDFMKALKAAAPLCPVCNQNLDINIKVPNPDGAVCLTQTFWVAIGFTCRRHDVWFDQREMSYDEWMLQTESSLIEKLKAISFVESDS